MNAYRHRPTQQLQFGSLVRSVVAATFLAAAGLSYLYLKHQLYVAGTRKQVMESELRDLSAQSRVLDSQIAALTSRTALQQRLKDGFIHMVEIPGTAVVRIRLLPEGSSTGLVSMGNVNAESIEPDGSGSAGEALHPISHAGRPALRTVRR